MSAVPAVAPKAPAKAPAKAVEWRVEAAPVEYPAALAHMEARVAAIHARTAPEQVWLLEHPPLYTAGTSARAVDLLVPDRFPVYPAGRGGQYTYHGPGQRIAYAMLDLRARKADIRGYVNDLEEWIIATLARFNVKGERRAGRVGVWVVRPELPPILDAEGRTVLREDKIAAIGVRVRKWVTFHGIAVNVAPDLSHYSGIVPCGISQHGVTSLRDLGLATTLDQADAALIAAFEKVFARKTTRI
jgi:lipoyl(octanoyl) transferase